MTALTRSTSARRAVFRWTMLLGGLLLGGPSPDARGDDPPDVNVAIQRIESLRSRGEYAEAIDSGRAALRAAEAAYGRGDRRTTNVIRALASACLETGAIAEAAPLLREARAVIERSDPVDEAALGSILGDLSQAVDDPEEGESLGRKALEIAERVHGADHPATALALNNLGALLREQARPDEAESLMRRALRIRERTDGMGSPLAAQSLCTLGQIAADRGEMSIAESLVRGSLEHRRDALPKGHPDRAESCLTLARILLVLGKERAGEALSLATEAFDAYVRTIGRSNLLTLEAMHVKANALAALGRAAESEQVHRNLVAVLEELPSSPRGLLSDVLQDSARHLVETGKPAQAAELCRRAISLGESTDGRDDARVVAARQILAEALYAGGNSDAAVAEGRAVLAAIERRGDADPLDAVAARFALAKYLLGVGALEEARSLLERCVTDLEMKTGRGSGPTLNAIHRLALVLLVTDELDEAERIVDDGLSRFHAADDVRSLDVATDLIGLRAKIYRKTGRIAEAERAEEAVRQTRAGNRR